MIVVTTDHAAHDPDRMAPAEGRPYWERPARIAALVGAIEAAGHQLVPARDAGFAPIARVHDAGYLDFLAGAYARHAATPGAGAALHAHSYAVRHQARKPASVAGQAGFYLGSSGAPILAGTWPAALGSAQAAIDAADRVLGGDAVCYALCRPPGHHACIDLAGGFCYLNNAAIAAQRLLDGGAGPVAILDFDVHHGNGTQHIFYQRDDVLYVSVHGDPAFLYPFYAGYADETGSGAGLGANLNLPLPPGTTDAAFEAAVARGLDAIAARGAAVLVVSLGFDAHDGDPTANLAVSSAVFAAIGRRIAALGTPVLLIQEGGYIVDKLAENLSSFLSGLLPARSSL